VVILRESVENWQSRVELCEVDGGVGSCSTELRVSGVVSCQDMSLDAAENWIESSGICSRQMMEESR
jgi:hypothetical protein